MLRCRSAESTRFFFASIDHVILWWRTHTHKLKSTWNVMIHGILLICMPCLGCWQPLCLAAGLALLALVLWFRCTNDSGEEQLLKFSGKLGHSKVSSENSFFLDFNLFYDASSINCQFNPNNSDCSFLESKFSFSHSTTTTPFGRLLRRQIFGAGGAIIQKKNREKRRKERKEKREREKKGKEEIVGQYFYNKFPSILLNLIKIDKNQRIFLV